MVQSLRKTTQVLACFFILMFLSTFLLPIAIAFNNNLVISDDLCVSASIDASHFIKATNTRISAGNNGNITVTFDITGTGIMTQIGSTQIELFENGAIIKTFRSSTTSGMMVSNRVMQAGSVSHRGVTGRTYRATVTFRAANNNGSDGRASQTSFVVAR